MKHRIDLRGKKTLYPVLLALLLLAVLVLLPTGYEGALAYQNADRVDALVLSTDESDIINTGLVRSGEQRCRVRILSGRFAGMETTAVNRLNGSLAEDKLFSPGDKAFVVVSHAAGEITTVYMTDHYRLGKEAVLAALFLLLLVLFARGTGLRVILSFADTVLLLWKVLVPSLLNGWNPILVSMALVLGLTCLVLGSGSKVPRGGVRRGAGYSGDGVPWLFLYRSVPDSRGGHGIQRKPPVCRLCASGSDQDLRRIHLPGVVRRSDGPFGRHLFRRP